MKRILIILFMATLLLMTACNGSNIEPQIEVTGENDIEETVKNNVVEHEKNNEIPIHPDEIIPEIKVLEPNSIGTVYMEATYTNNSEYPIVGYNLTVLLKDKNEKTYLGTYDTVMPGETSPKFDSFGPETQNPDDYEILKLEVTAKLDDGNKLYIDYDFKLEEASWWKTNN